MDAIFVPSPTSNARCPHSAALGCCLQLGRAPLATPTGLQEVQAAERVFFLSQQQVEQIQGSRGSFRLQVSCLQLHDEVMYR